MRGLPSRFIAKIRKSPNGCWHWTGYVDANGYGHFSIGSRTDGTRRDVQAHRFAYTQTVQPLTEKRGEEGHLQVDHQCHNLAKSCKGGPTCPHRRCVNPAHLRAVVAKVNKSAGRSTKGSKRIPRTHCKYGHEFTEENTYISSSTGRRWCKQCQIDNSRENRRKKAAIHGPIPHYQTTKTQCPQGHPLSGDNLVNRSDGARSCRTCARRRSLEWKLTRTSRQTRGLARRRTQCPYGHPLSGDNLYVAPKTGARACRTCRQENNRKRRARAQHE